MRGLTDVLQLRQVVHVVPAPTHAPVLRAVVEPRPVALVTLGGVVVGELGLGVEEFAPHWAPSSRFGSPFLTRSRSSSTWPASALLSDLLLSTARIVTRW